MSAPRPGGSRNEAWEQLQDTILNGPKDVPEGFIGLFAPVSFGAEPEECLALERIVELRARAYGTDFVIDCAGLSPQLAHQVGIALDEMFAGRIAPKDLDVAAVERAREAMRELHARGYVANLPQGAEE